MRIIYLHGFASSTQSRKAQFFAAKLTEIGLQLELPDLAEGAFERLTVSGQLRLIEETLGDDPAILIGSSLGGYLAALYAAKHHCVSKIILLAPAFDFYQLWIAALGPERLANWRREGSMCVYHYGQGREVPLSVNFLEDAHLFEPFPDVHQPALIFHGERDSVVPIEQSITFARNHPDSRLIRLESGHELTDVLEAIWESAREFLVEN